MWRNSHREYCRDKELFRKYGIGIEWYKAVLSLQDNRCAICGTDDPGGRSNVFHIDHNHETGELRGLLCYNCNTALGYLKDRTDVLAKAIEYLKRGIPVYQKMILSGHLGGDPVVKYTTSGAAVANFNIAVDESYKDKAGQLQKRVEWIPVVCWEKLAELANDYLKKGSLVLIEGKLQTRSWSDQSTGEKKYKTEVVASTIKFLDKKESKLTEVEEPF